MHPRHACVGWNRRIGLVEVAVDIWIAGDRNGGCAIGEVVYVLGANDVDES